MTPPPNPRQTEIRAVQYGRGVAALLVCLFHFEFQTQTYFGSYGLGNLFAAGYSGVDFFFVLSGYIIYRSHQSDIGRPECARAFYVKRALRILPMYWLVALPLGVTILSSNSLGIDRDLTGSRFVTDLLLIPREGVLTLPPAWTLQFELVFYLVFATMILNRRAGIVLFVAWQGACVAGYVFDLVANDELRPVNKLLGLYNLGFLFGLAIAVVDRHVGLEDRPRLALGSGLLAVAGLLPRFAAQWRGDASSWSAGPLTYFALYSLALVALIATPNRPRPLLDRTLGTLGAASYVLYLSHEPVQSALYKVLTRPGFQGWIGAGTAYMLSIVVSVATAVLIHSAIERPVLARLRRIVLPARPDETTPRRLAS